MEAPYRRPIGIFDSGIGGVTIAKAIADQMPRESIIYFGDTLHLPYGEKSKPTIIKYSQRITDFLIQEEVKMIVIACNTASVYAYEALRNRCQQRGIPCLNVIDPVVQQVRSDPAINQIGVIGTRATIASAAYQEKITLGNGSKKVIGLATPLLAPMVEEGIYGQELSRQVVRFYLSKRELQSIDSLILGCTHYPLLVEDIAHYYQGRVKLLDVPRIVALQAENLLRSKGIQNINHKYFPNKWYVSEHTPMFEKNASMFFGDTIQVRVLPSITVD